MGVLVMHAAEAFPATAPVLLGDVSRFAATPRLR